MKTEILDYIRGQRVCVVALEMPDGSPHAATVHFAHAEDPLTFIIQTNPSYRKSEPLLIKDLVRASLVIGLSEAEGGKDKTFQVDGLARLVKPDERYKETYLKKFPEKEGKWVNDIFFIVSPTWWRFTDWSKPEGKTAIYSDESVFLKDQLLK